MTRASDIREHSPHCIGAENDAAACQHNWLGDSFPNLIQSDHIWVETICTSHLWNEWGPSGRIRDVPFLQLLATNTWDSNEEALGAKMHLSRIYTMITL